MQTTSDVTMEEDYDYGIPTGDVYEDDYEQPPFTLGPDIKKSEVPSQQEDERKPIKVLPNWLESKEAFEGFVNRTKDIDELKKAIQEVDKAFRASSDIIKAAQEIVRLGGPKKTTMQAVQKYYELIEQIRPHLDIKFKAMIQKARLKIMASRDIITGVSKIYRKFRNVLTNFNGKALKGYKVLENDPDFHFDYFKGKYNNRSRPYMKTFKMRVKSALKGIKRAGRKLWSVGKQAAVETAANTLADLGQHFGVALYDELHARRLNREYQEMIDRFDGTYNSLTPREKELLRLLSKYMDVVNANVDELWRIFQTDVKDKLDKKLSDLKKDEIKDHVIQDNSKPHTPLTFPNQNYEGPGNYLMSGKPKDEADRTALKHDWLYHLSKYSYEITEADKKAIQEFGRIYKRERSLTSFVGWLGIQAKYFIETYIVGQPIYPFRYAIRKSTPC